MQFTGTESACQLVSSVAPAPGESAGAGREAARPSYLETPAQNCGQSPYGAAGHVPKIIEVNGQRMPVESVAYCVAPHRCRSRFCPQCGPRDGRRLRKQVNEVVETFTGVMMWTLTVDPTLFASPEAAFRYVREKRCVAELCRVLRERGGERGGLHSDRWFYVLEFQENGMPHWHLLVDASFIDFELVKSVWNRFRPKSAGPVVGDRPAFGAVRFSAPKFASKSHAANYATKYVIKTPEAGWPSWVLTFQGRIKRYGVSQGFWGGCGAVSDKPKNEAMGQALQRYGVKAVGLSSVLFDDGSEVAVGGLVTFGRLAGEAVVSVDCIAGEVEFSGGELVYVESPAAISAARRVEAHNPTCFCEVCRGDESGRRQESTVGQRVVKCGRGCSLMEVLTAVDGEGNGHQVWRWFCEVETEYGRALEYLGIEAPELPRCVFVSAAEAVRLEGMYRSSSDGFEAYIERVGWLDTLAWYNANRGRPVPVKVSAGDVWTTGRLFDEDEAEC